MYKPPAHNFDAADDGISDEEEDPFALSPESWAPPTGPGLLASSIELGTQPWVRNDWCVVDEDDLEKAADQERNEEANVTEELSTEEEPFLLQEEDTVAKAYDESGQSVQLWPREITSKVPPVLPTIALNALEPPEPALSPRIKSPRVVRLGRTRTFDDIWLDPAKAPKDEKDTFTSQFSKLLGRWAGLTNAPRELWIIYGLKFLSSYAYFSLMLILTTFLTNEYGLSDTAAGWTYGMYGLMSTFYGLLCGWFIDSMGVRRSLIVGALFGSIARAILALSPSPHMSIITLYTVLPFSECLGIPIMSIGIKRYTNRHNRTYAFSLFYSMMNLAALCSGPVIDFARVFLRGGIGLDLKSIGYANTYQMSSLRLVIFTGSISTALMCLIVYFFVREIDVDAHGNVKDFTPMRQSPYDQTMEVLRNPVFWRLTLFTFLLVGVRLVFRHLDATFPKYVVRQFGRDAPYGMFYAINPLLIIFLVPIIGLMTRHIHSFTMIQYGSIVAAASPFIMCLGGTYLSVVLFMVILSIGEAVYSPRVYEYTMEVSGHGAEGLYSSLAAAPLFSVQLIVGGMSGWLLTKFMPRHGVRNGTALWGIIGATAMTSPVLIWLLKDVINPQKDIERDFSELESDQTLRTHNAYGSIRSPKRSKKGLHRKSRSFSAWRHKQKQRSPVAPTASTSNAADPRQSVRPGRPPVYPKNEQSENSAGVDQ